MTNLGPDWVVGEDGHPHRRGARVVLFDSDNKILLLRGHDAHDPSHEWWFTIGGGLKEGEDPRDGAVRELKEETGIELGPGDLKGPVLYRESKFPFANVTARQDELFFIAHARGSNIPIRHANLSDVEKLVLDEFRWFTLEELDEVAKGMPIYPPQLPELVRKWSRGWDGVREFISEW